MTGCSFVQTCPACMNVTKLPGWTIFVHIAFVGPSLYHCAIMPRWRHVQYKLLKRKCREIVSITCMVHWIVNSTASLKGEIFKADVALQVLSSQQFICRWTTQFFRSLIVAGTIQKDKLPWYQLVRFWPNGVSPITLIIVIGQTKFGNNLH